MQRAFLAIAAVAAIGLAVPAVAAEAGSAYAGQQTRTIKALSDDDVAGLRNGDGMGLAKAAELNGYPGPRHVLALGHELRLSDAQLKEVAAIRDRMSDAARAFGKELIVRERELDDAFAQGTITPRRLARDTAAIAALQGRLRAVHLAAHLETRAVLDAAQRAEYDRLRGYAAAGPSDAAINTQQHQHQH